MKNSSTKARPFLKTSVEIRLDLDERIQREVIRRDGRFGRRHGVINEALEKGLAVIEQEAEATNTQPEPVAMTA